MTTTTPDSRGQLAYTAYGRSRNWTAVDGSEMPLWAEIHPDIRAAWVAAAGVIWDLATTGRATI